MERLSQQCPCSFEGEVLIATALDPWFVENLVCPRDHAPLAIDAGTLGCRAGHRYPIVDGVPVMLLDDRAHTIDFMQASLDRARNATGGDPRAPELYLESLGISEDEKRGVVALASRGSRVDPVVAYLVAATNGLMYRNLIGALENYPIPEIRLPDGHGELLLDVGCSWGRWTIAAAQRGYQVVGVDPSLGAIMAARRVAASQHIAARFVVGDARVLPFRTALFDRVYSYSVIQHFSRTDAAAAVDEMARVLKAGGHAKVQMPSKLGIRCIYHQAQRRFREPAGFEVRYWSLPALSRMFGRLLQDVRVDVDGFFGIGLQPGDAHLMPVPLRITLAVSEALRAASGVVRPLVWVADSVFVEATKGA